ncbi:hypothetical protein [Staphylococcus pasteuri]|uniref:hypothetical protein n=1 Tax=Staphylococcus pasteuri TaxID=45972 RepID=UPI0012B8F097|nr:hypothetical protein [Staphylococcus pasteuri]
MNEKQSKYTNVKLINYVGNIFVFLGILFFLIRTTIETNYDHLLFEINIIIFALTFMIFLFRNILLKKSIGIVSSIILIILCLYILFL